MQDFLHKKIIIGISGGIAAYKTAYLVRELKQLGAEVRVVMTDSAQQFISPMTLQALSGEEVRTEIFDERAESAMGHIELARWADYFVIAPASADCIAKMAHGFADNLLTTLYLVAEVPVLVCPAMNRSMWAHPATVANCEELKRHGVIFVGPDEGAQACGEYGFGRMSEVQEIINTLRLCELNPCLSGQQILITAGPTNEAIDPVRYISNHSSGKMGYALALAAQKAGAEVTLISGPTQLPPPVGVRFFKVQTANEMHALVLQQLQKGMIYIGAAAVGDYSVVDMADKKMKRDENPMMSLSLKMNPDILSEVVASQKALYTIGFAAETHDVLTYAEKKFKQKKVDMLIANQVGPNLGFGQDENQVIVITKKEQVKLPSLHKVRLAAEIMTLLAAQLENN